MPSLKDQLLSLIIRTSTELPEDVRKSLREARERLQAEGLRKNELYAAALRIKDVFDVQ